MKFGNHSQISQIAAEVGGSVATVPPEAQIELFDVLIEGCTEAVKVGSLDPKVGFEYYSANAYWCFQCGHIMLLF